MFPYFAMHIPDGFLSVTVSVILWVVSAVILIIALGRVNRDLGEREVPVMGVLAAAIFAGQMLNFTVAGGTSGHLLGAALAAILLGPWAAVIVMTSVVSVQALIFQDGGLLVLGANIFNMAIVGPFVAHAIYRLILRLSNGRSWGIFAGGFAAAWASIEIASFACALQLSLSGISPANITVPAMGGIHAIIGIGEGLITIGALSLVYAARRDLLVAGESRSANNRIVWVGGLILTLLLAVLSPFASAHPDGLEWVAEQAGFIEAAQDPSYEIIPDYVFPGIADEALATILAGVVGALIVLGVALITAHTRSRRAVSEE